MPADIRNTLNLYPLRRRDHSKRRPSSAKASRDHISTDSSKRVAIADSSVVKRNQRIVIIDLLLLPALASAVSAGYYSGG